MAGNEKKEVEGKKCACGKTAVFKVRGKKEYVCDNMMCKVEVATKNDDQAILDRI